MQEQDIFQSTKTAIRQVFERYYLWPQKEQQATQIVTEQGLGKTKAAHEIAAEYAKEFHVRIMAPSHKLVNEQFDKLVKVLEEQEQTRAEYADPPFHETFAWVNGIEVRIIKGREQPKTTQSTPIDGATDDDPADVMCDHWQEQRTARAHGVHSATICGSKNNGEGCECVYRQQFDSLASTGITICPHEYSTIRPRGGLTNIPPVDIEIIDEAAWTKWFSFKRFQFDTVAKQRKPYGDGTERQAHILFGSEQFPDPKFDEFRDAFLTGNLGDFIRSQGERATRIFSAQAEAVKTERRRRLDAKNAAKTDEDKDTAGDGHRWNATYNQAPERFLDAQWEQEVLSYRRELYKRLAHEAQDILAGRKDEPETVWARPSRKGDNGSVIYEVEFVERESTVCPQPASCEPTPHQESAFGQSEDERDATPNSVILLDGTADARINSVWFPKLDEHRMKLGRRNATIIQARDSAMGKSSAYLKEGERIRDFIFRVFLLMLYEAGANNLGLMPVVMNEVIENRAIKEFPLIEHFKKAGLTQHFNNTRGLDILKQYMGMVIIGRTEPQLWEIERLARGVFGSSRRAEDEDGGLELSVQAPARDGALTWQVTGQQRVPVLKHNKFGEPVYAKGPIASHQDPRCEAILKQIRDYELEQTLDRLRCAGRHEGDPDQPRDYLEKKKPKRVFLLTSAPVGDLEADEVLDIEQILPRPNGIRHSLIWSGVAMMNFEALAETRRNEKDNESADVQRKRWKRVDEPDETAIPILLEGPHIAKAHGRENPDYKILPNGRRTQEYFVMDNRDFRANLIAIQLMKDRDTPLDQLPLPDPLRALADVTDQLEFKTPTKEQDHEQSTED